MAPKGGRGGRRNNLPMSREVQISKKLSWLLRHGAQEEGLKLGEGGYIDLEAVVSTSSFPYFYENLCALFSSSSALDHFLLQDLYQLSVQSLLSLVATDD